MHVCLFVLGIVVGEHERINSIKNSIAPASLTPPLPAPASALTSLQDCHAGARKTGQIMNEHLVACLNIQLDMPIVSQHTSPPLLQVVSFPGACPSIHWKVSEDYA